MNLLKKTSMYRKKNAFEIVTEPPIPRPVMHLIIYFYIKIFPEKVFQLKLCSIRQVQEQLIP